MAQALGGAVLAVRARGAPEALAPVALAPVGLARVGLAPVGLARVASVQVVWAQVASVRGALGASAPVQGHQPSCSSPCR